MRAFRLLLRVVAALVAVPLLAVAVLYGLLRSGVLDGRIDGLVALLARKEGVFFVRVEGLEGDLPEHLVVRKVEIGDATDVYLTIENAEAWWHPFDLFHPFDHSKWKVNVDEIHAERVTWTRLPHDAEPDEEPFHWDKFVRIVAGHLLVEDFDLRGTLLGGAVERVRAEGSGVLGEWEHGFVKLDLEHIEGRTGKARIDLATHGTPLELTGRITAEEGPDGALAALARLDDAGAVTLDLRASGAMRDWHAQADVSAANIGVLHADASLSFNAQGPFEVRGTFDPAPLQRERYLVGPGAPIDLLAKGAWAPDVELRLDRVVLTADGRELSASGRLDLDTKEFLLEAGLVQKNDGQPVKLTILDAAAARLKGKGVLGDGGHLEATLDLDAPVVGAVVAGDFHASLRARDEKGDSVPTFDLAAAAKGLATGRSPLPILGSEATLVAAGRIDLLEGRLDAEGAHLKGGDLSVKGPVSFSDRWKTMTASLRAEASTLASLESLVGAKMSGRAGAALEFTAKSAWSEVDTKLHVDTADVVVGEAGWNALVGGASTIDATWTGAPKGQSRGTATAKASGIEATAAGEWGAGGRNLVADARVVVDNLSKLSDPARAAVSGRAEATVKVRGDLGHFDAVGRLQGQRLVLRGARFDSLVAEVDAKGSPQAWSATVRSNASLGKQRATLDATVETPSAGRLLVRRAELHGPRSDVTADLDLDLERALVAGTLRASIQDLSAWRPMTGLDATGAIDVDARLAATGGVQQVSGTAKVRKASLVTGGSALFVDALDASADGVVLGPRPQGRASVRATKVRYGATSLVEGTATAVADGRAWAFESSLDVRDAANLRATLAGTLLPGPPLELTLARLDGTVDATPLALRGPARLRVDAAGWTISGAALTVGSAGTLSVDASRSGGRTRLSAQAGQLPLSFAAVFAPSLDLTGTVDGSLRVEGADLASSTGEISLRGRGLGSSGLEHQGVAPVDVNADATLGGRRLRGSASVAGLSDSRLELKLDAPLAGAAGSDPLVIDLLWKGNVADVAALLPFGVDTIGGRIDAGLRLSGTVSSPRVTGRAVLEAGVWENAATGLVLRDLHLELEGLGSELRLLRADGTDGEKGRVSATGRVAFGRFPAFDADFSLDAKAAMLARLDSVTARADAKLTLHASRDATPYAAIGGLLSGSVRVDEARITIPQRFVADVPEIVVVEVTSDDSQADAAALPPVLSALDLDVAVVADNRIVVTGRGVESEWASDVHVRGSTMEPRVEGTVRSVRGQLSLLGRRFDVDSGTLLFDGAPGNIPYLTLTARAEANDITAIATVTGPATTPTIDLRSEPALPRDEVLSRVLFGQSAANLTAMQSVQLARSLAELTGSPLGGGSGMLTGIGRTLGFDRLEIESSGSDGGAALTASRYLTDNVYLRVQQGLTPEASKLSIEWRVMKHITIESDVSQDAQGEVGATWRWDY